MSISVKVVRAKRSPKGVTSDFKAALGRVIASGVQDTMNTAKQSIHAHSSGGKTYQKYNPKRTHTASAAGNPPNTDTGYLANNIHMVMDADGMGGSVESKADYSGFLEFGTSKMKARPYLQPALEENKPKVLRRIKALRLKGVR